MGAYISTNSSEIAVRRSETLEGLNIGGFNHRTLKFQKHPNWRGEGLLNMCYHGAWGAPLILHWNSPGLGTRQLRKLIDGQYEASH